MLGFRDTSSRLKFALTPYEPDNMSIGFQSPLTRNLGGFVAFQVLARLGLLHLRLDLLFTLIAYGGLAPEPTLYA